MHKSVSWRTEAALDGCDTACFGKRIRCMHACLYCVSIGWYVHPWTSWRPELSLYVRAATDSGIKQGFNRLCCVRTFGRCTEAASPQPAPQHAAANESTGRQWCPMLTPLQRMTHRHTHQATAELVCAALPPIAHKQQRPERTGSKQGRAADQQSASAHSSALSLEAM
jgi:hypothetical protein